MTHPRLATRYAKSLIDLSKERGELEIVYKDMLYLQQLTSLSKDFVAMLKSPIIPADKKLSIIKAITSGKISELTNSFAKLLVTKGREADLPEITTAFVRQYKTFKGIYVVKLTTAAPVSESVKQTIIDQVRATSEMQNIELQTVIDEKLIGGFILQAGDKLVDASILYDLKEVSKQFENNDFIYKVR
jgi:F-type H+-transporting ATPase subunit delta